MSEDCDRKALTNRAVAASIAVASTHCITVNEPKILADAYSVRVHLQPAPIVVRVSTLTPILRYPIASWLLRELAVSEFWRQKRSRCSTKRPFAVWCTQSR